MKGRKSVWVCGARNATPKIHYPQKAQDCEYKNEMNLRNDHWMSKENDGFITHGLRRCVRESVRTRAHGTW